MLAVNTHGFYKKLVAKGFSTEQAEGLTEAHTEFFEEAIKQETKLIKVDFKDELPSKDDFKNFKEEIQSDFKNFKEEIQSDFKNFKEEIQSDVRNFKEEIQSDVRNFKEEIQSDIRNFKEEIQNDFQEIRKELEKFATKAELEKFATKEELQEVKNELKKDIFDVKLEISEIKGDMKVFKWMLAVILLTQAYPFIKNLFITLGN